MTISLTILTSILFELSLLTVSSGFLTLLLPLEVCVLEAILLGGEDEGEDGARGFDCVSISLATPVLAALPDPNLGLSVDSTTSSRPLLVGDASAEGTVCLF